VWIDWLWRGELEMGLQDYVMQRDKFEFKNSTGNTFDFPCCVCANNRKDESEEPCRTCDHNVNAEAE
jgi:hypothetical protein